MGGGEIGKYIILAVFCYGYTRLGEGESIGDIHRALGYEIGGGERRA